MDFKNLILTFTFLANAFFGYLSYFRSKKTKVNLAWVFVVGSVIFWIVSMIFFRSVSPEITFLWCRILYISAVFIPVAFLYFVSLFPKEKWQDSKTSLILVSLSALIIIFLVAFSNVILKEVIIKPGQEKEIIFGPSYFLYALYIAGFFSFSLWKLFRKYLKSFGVLKNQLRYILIGTGAGILFGCAFSLILPWFGDFRLNEVGPVPTLFMVIFVSYAISRYRLMDIRIILTEFLVILITFVLLVEVVASETLYEVLYKTGIFLIFCLFGYLLIKNVINEIKRRKELEKLTKELKDAYEELKKLDKAKSEFISIASHQLRTPLAAIKSYISMIIEGSYGRVSPRMKPPLKNVYTSNERLIKLINTLLNISRIEAGRSEMEFEKTSLEDIISSVVKELEIEAKEKKIYLKWERPFHPLPRLLIDREKMRQVILNIIDNAIRYTSKGGVTIKIKRQPLKVKIIISDTGEGMEKEEIPQIFRIFSRGKSGGKLWTEGAGLGLFVAKKFTEMNKGRIWAESPGRGKGSTFYIELPIS